MNLCCLDKNILGYKSVQISTELYYHLLSQILLKTFIK